MEARQDSQVKCINCGEMVPQEDAIKTYAGQWLCDYCVDDLIDCLIGEEEKEDANDIV